jgi:uncharacterized membrane protein
MSRFPLRTILFVSLALNLLFVGALIGARAAGVRLERAGVEQAFQRGPGPRAFMGALSPENRAMFREELARTWLSSREERAQSRRARRALYAAAAEEPYDAEKVRAAFAAQRTADQATIAVFHDAIAEALGKVDPAERRRVIDAVAQAQRLRAPAPARAADESPAP